MLIEDPVSFGGSSLGAVEALEEEGGKVIGVQAIFTYGFPKAAQRFAAAGKRVLALTSFDALLETIELDARYAESPARLARALKASSAEPGARGDELLRGRAAAHALEAERCRSGARTARAPRPCARARGACSSSPCARCAR